MRTRPLPTAARLPLLALGGAALLVGMWGGLARLGGDLPAGALPVANHGPLMVSGFLGTVIALERAVALRRPWGYVAPVLCAAGAALTLLTSWRAGPLLSLLGSAGGLAILVRVVWMDRALHHVLMAVAALAWCGGNALWAAGAPLFDVVPWWLAFLVLTIAAERLELNRLLRPSRRARVAFGVAALGLVAGAAVSLLARDLGLRLVGASCVALALWLLVHDVARRTVRQRGAVRYIAVALLSGYFWLGVGGALAAWGGNPLAGPRYDAVLHALFVGFVLSMVFGHALVILPAVLGVAVDFRPRFYGHLGVLHASLALRLAGDLLLHPGLRQLGGWLNAAAVLLFLVSTVAGVRRTRPSRVALLQ